MFCVIKGNCILNKILIVIDSFKREFTGISFLKEELERTGFNVKLTSRFSLALAYNNFIPDIVVVPKTHKISELKHIYNQTYVVQLGAESFSGARKALTSCKESKAGGGWQDDFIDLTLCWGDFNRDIFKELGAFRNSKIITTGNPITETWYKKKITREKKEKKIIGISLSLRTITHKNAPGIVQTIVDTELDNFFYDDGFHAESWIAFEVSWIRVITNLIQRFSRDFEIQLRPHPLEDHTLYDYFVKKFPNVSIHASKDIIDWCDQIDILLSYMSTSQIDAHIRGVKVISIKDLFPKFVLDGIPDMMNLEMNDYFPNCVDFENLEMMIRDNNKVENDQLTDFIKNVFNFPSQARPSISITKEIRAFLDEKKINKSSSFKKIKIYGKVRFLSFLPNSDLIHLLIADFLYSLRGGFDPKFSYCPHRIIKNKKIQDKVSSFIFE